MKTQKEIEELWDAIETCIAHAEVTPVKENFETLPNDWELLP